MASMTGGQALVQALKQEGIETIFGLPGVQLDWAFDALHAAQEYIHVVHTRHEQATAYMADGYARTTGKIGTCLVVPGPGFLNAAAGISTAYACNSPVLCLTGQIQSDLIGARRGVLHEIEDQLGLAQHITKWAGRPMTPAEVPGSVHEAFRQLRSGRPRPVHLEIPPDVLQTAVEVDLGQPLPVDRSAGDPDLLEQAARILGQAERPLIFSGGGVLAGAAWAELQRVAELLEAPVVMSGNGRGAISDHHYLAQVQVGLPRLLPKADAILAVGTRMVQMGNVPIAIESGVPCIRVDADPDQIERTVKPTHPIVADAALALTELANRIERHNRKRASRRDELMGVKRHVAELMNAGEPQSLYGRALREELPEDTIVVTESTQVGYWCTMGLPAYQPRTYLTSGYQGTLGYGFPTALGAKVGNPDRQVVSLNGDGGFMFNVQELSTAARHNIGVTIVVFDDGAYGNVRRTQEVMFGGRTIASDLKNPDFVKLAELFGVQALRADGPDGFRTALRESLKIEGPLLIHVPVGPMPMYFRYIREQLQKEWEEARASKV